jgi:hypothetical protein
MTTKTPLLFAQLVLATAVLGCATKPTLSLPTAIDVSLTQQQSVRQVSLLSNSNTKVFDPGEIIRIRAMDKGRYLCRDGRPLVCDRIGSTSYCTCPGIWQHR